MSPGSPPTRRGERGRRSPPLPAARHMALCCFSSPAPPGLSPLRHRPGAPSGQLLSCLLPPAARVEWDGPAWPAAPSSPGPQVGLGWRGAVAVLQCEPPWPSEVLHVPAYLFFFYIGIFSFIVFFFFFPEQFFAASRIGWRRGGYFGAVLCGELHLLLHCRPKLGELVKPVLSNHFRGQVREEKQTLGREVASLIKARAGPSCGPCGREKVSGCLAEAGCGSGMCRAGCALPASSCGSGPAAPRVRKTCAVVCAETQGCFPAREQGAAAKEAPQPAPFATTREGLCSSLHTRLGPHRVRLCREQATNRPHKT